MKRILITGGAGFVGRHFTKKFLELGYEVHCLDSLEPGSGGIDPLSGWPLFNPLDFNNFIWINKDCRDYFKNRLEINFDYVFHLAAVVGGRLTIENNPLAVARDLAIDADFWEWASKSRPNKVVAFSSSAAYPVNLQMDIRSEIALKEDMIDFSNGIGVPDLTYGWAKLTNEYLAKIAWERYGINSVIYRPFSGYGNDQDSSYPFPSICKRAIKNKNSKIFEVWGSGKQARDFIHIDDCVDGVLITMDKINNAEALNLSTGKLTSFIDFAKIATNFVGYDPEIIGDSSKPEGVVSRFGDTAKQKLFGFTPKIPFQDGVRDCLAYIQNET